MMLETAPVSCHLSALSYMGSREILKAGDLEEKILLFSWDVAHMSMYDNSVLFSYMCLQRHKWHNTELVRGTWMPSWCLITGKCSLEMSQGILWIPQLAFSAVSASLPLRCCDLIHCPVPKCCVQFSALPSKDDLAIVSLGAAFCRMLLFFFFFFPDWETHPDLLFWWFYKNQMVWQMLR